MKRLPLGKISIDLLSSAVLAKTGAASDRIVTPPKAGLDFAAIKLDSGYMIVSADPITGVAKEVGRYAVSVSANDVATSGCRPRFVESVVMLPEASDSGTVRDVASQIHQEAKRLGISIVGGHTEVTPGLDRPIVVITAFGFTDRFVSSSDARDGDTIMMTKTAGLEGTSILARRRSRGKGARGYSESISIVEEAVAAYRTGYVHAMHDCTEGGVLGAAFEMSLAAGVGFTLYEEKVPVAPLTRSICRRRSIDPLKLIGSGALLLSVEAGKEAEVIEALRPLCSVSGIGRFTRGGRLLVREGGRKEVVRTAPEDELWRVLERSV